MLHEEGTALHIGEKLAFLLPLGLAHRAFLSLYPLRQRLIH